MDRLLAINGGQQLKANDWKFIQDATAAVLKSLVEGLKNSTGPCIVAGLEVTIADGVISVSEGVLFDGEELCHVPADSFTYNGGELDNSGSAYVLYFTPDTTTGESRVFKDETSHDVYEYRSYALGYDEAVPEGSLAYPARLMNALSDYVIARMPATPAQLLLERQVSLSAGILDQYQTIIPAPGVGKMIKVKSISARITPVTQLQVDDQTLDLFYGTDSSEVGVGSFPSTFLESSSSDTSDMTPVHTSMYENQAIRAQLSGAQTPSSGSATIKFYCYYVIITL